MREREKKREIHIVREKERGGWNEGGMEGGMERRREGGRELYNQQ